MVFSCFRRQSGTAPHHLTIQAPHLGWSENHNTIHRRAIPALCQEHRIAQHVILPGIKIFQNFSSVLAVSIYLCSPESILIQQVTEFLAGLYQRKEYHCFLIHAVFLHFFCDPLQIRIQCGADFACFKVSSLH